MWEKRTSTCRICLAALLLTFAGASHGELCGTASSEAPRQADQITIPLEGRASWGKESYYHGLLRRVLDITEGEYGTCELVNAPYVLTRSRMTQAVYRGQGMDVLWASATREREKQMRAIHIPLLKGLMSYKLVLINEGEQKQFRGVDSVEKLRRYRVGAGLDWPDAEIMRANELQVLGTNNYGSLFKMLAAGRFDMVLRGANEISAELDAYDDLKLASARDIMVVYPSPVYFFVHPKHEGLAQRLKLGLTRMMEDGSFDDYFYAHPSIENALHLIRRHQRKIIYLDNPLLPVSAPLTQQNYWLFPWVKDTQGRWVIDPEHEHQITGREPNSG